jgi:two-component system LytT family response regulator
MRVVVVEDSRLARAELRTLLAAAPDVQIVGEADDLEAGCDAVDTLKPDLLLLDIQLPGGTGFDLLDRIDHLPLVVFTTAYDQHALDAFERNAIDYLVKPIVPERLAAALGRTRERLASLRASANANAAATPGAPRKGADEMVFVRDGERCWFVRLGDISGFEACGNYAQAWFDGKRPLVGRTLAQLEERLDDALFFRASRSHLVNLRWIDQVVPWINDGYRVTLRDGHTVEVSRRQAKVLRERLEL